MTWKRWRIKPKKKKIRREAKRREKNKNDGLDIISTHLHAIIAINVSFYNCETGEGPAVGADIAQTLYIKVQRGALVCQSKRSRASNFTKEQLHWAFLPQHPCLFCMNEQELRQTMKLVWKQFLEVWNLNWKTSKETIQIPLMIIERFSSVTKLLYDCFFVSIWPWLLLSHYCYILELVQEKI